MKTKYSVSKTEKLIIELFGQEVGVIIRDRYEMLSHEKLCEGLIISTKFFRQFGIKLNGIDINPDLSNVVCTPKEVVLSRAWTTSKSLDWNNSISYYGKTSNYICEIAVEGEFNPTKLKYNCICPITVSVGKKNYKFKHPILQYITYEGITYPINIVSKQRYLKW